MKKSLEDRLREKYQKEYSKFAVKLRKIEFKIKELAQKRFK